ncbi:MAG: VWA domain-containing protein [Lachnospiraceae bacterium]|nr:VWA domain-containing protein [Lachnospiraceae bacterium]
MKKNRTELVFILDESGSMYGLESDTIGGFNSVIDKQKKEEGEVIVTTVLFSDRHKLVHDRFPIESVKKMTERDYCPGGCTALLDAMGSTMAKLENVQRNLPEDERAEHVIFTIITDGMENASCEYSKADIKRMVEKHTEEGWEFLFMGANMDAIGEAATMGIRADRAVSYCADEVGTQMNFEAACCAMSEMRAMPKGMRAGARWKEKIEKRFSNDEK